MTKNNQRWHQWTMLPVAAAVAASISAPANAFQFYLGDIEGSLDTTLSAGASWRVEDRDHAQLGQGNLGVPAGSTTGASTSNTDNGNWNFKKGETYSKLLKGTTDLLLRYEDYGAFTRLRYFYDVELKDETRAYDNVGQTRPLGEDTLDQAGADVRFLDAYVWADLYAGETPINVRFGRQVVSWGESTFIFGGINSVNPVDFSAARAPGAEVKDVLMPVTMLYGSVGVSQDVTVEAFYQLEWEKTEPDPCGTFYSNNDVATDGCGPIYLAGQIPEALADAQGLYVARAGDDEPDNDGIFGMAVRWYAANLGDTEFGFYYTRTHSTIPYASFISSQVAANPTTANYFITYPEDIDQFAISFNTSTDNGWSIGGEISHRPDMPVARNGFEMTASALGQKYGAFVDDWSPGEVIRGYDEFPMTQAQVTFIKFFDQILGASRLTFVSEFGAVYLDGIPDNSRYGRDSTFGIGPVITGSGDECTNPSVNINPSYCVDDGYVTDLSAGYRMRFSLDYPDVAAGINLTPVLSWSHDVYGYGPIIFREGSKSVGLTLNALYLNKYSASIGYVSYFGGEPFNYLNDRDTVSASVGVSF